MKKILLLLVFVCLLLPATAYAEPPLDVEGDFTYAPLGCEGERWADGNQFLWDCADVGNWYQGDFDGTSTEVYEVIFFKSDGNLGYDHAYYQGHVTFEGTVAGKTGTVEIMMQGTSPRPGDPAYWVGTWRTMGGTGELANIHGSGTIENNGLLDVHYQGRINFSP